MKLLILISTFILLSIPSLADHTVADAMERMPTLKKQIDAIIKKEKVFCYFDASEQSLVEHRWEKPAGNIWKQITLCYKTQKDLDIIKENSAKGRWPTLSRSVGVLVVTYINMEQFGEDIKPADIVISAGYL